MDTITSFINNKTTFLLLEDIKKKNINTEYFIGCKTVRKCVEKHDIPDEKCLYMKNGKVYTKNYKSADLFIEEQYAKINIMNKEIFKKKKEVENKNKKNDKSKQQEKNKEQLNEKRAERKDYDEDDITEIPELVLLEDNEMFQDSNGEPMDIDVRGEKTQEGIYFNAYDIGKAFDYTSIYDVVVDKRSDHKYDRDFKYFHSDTGNSSIRMEIKKKVLYLTYMGVLKVLFSARGNKAERFQKWATKILFTMQMGAQDDKDKLAAKALNVDVSTVTQLFRKSVRAIPCVYLFEVGTVGNMRQHFNLENFPDDNDKVYKYGRTEDIGRRNNEHCKTYGKLKGNTFGLTLFSYLDEKFVSKAETKLKHYFNNTNTHIDDDKQNELVVIKKDKFSYIKELYNEIYMVCSGNNQELIQQIQKMESDHQNELLKKDHHIEVMKLQYSNDLKDAELKYMQQLLNMKLNS
jgi:prophage antirepressor-like protein